MQHRSMYRSSCMQLLIIMAELIMLLISSVETILSIFIMQQMAARPKAFQMPMCMRLM